MKMQEKRMKKNGPITEFYNDAPGPPAPLCSVSVSVSLVFV